MPWASLRCSNWRYNRICKALVIYNFKFSLSHINFQAENQKNSYLIDNEILRKGCIGFTRIKLSVLRTIPSTLEPTTTQDDIYETPVCTYLMRYFYLKTVRISAQPLTPIYSIYCELNTVHLICRYSNFVV